MIRTSGAAAYLPAHKTLAGLREAVNRCRGCDLYKPTTQAVFGAGRVKSQLLFIGEQPGNEEDLQGRPFAGPAGRILDRAFEDAGIVRTNVYVTNAVKHFKFEERGKRRIHKKPAASEVQACKPWLDAEIASVRPKLLVCLGATAAQSRLGRDFRLTRERGKVIVRPGSPPVLATIHPSAILRIPEAAGRREEYSRFVADLKLAAAFAGSAESTVSG